MKQKFVNRLAMHTVDTGLQPVSALRTCLAAQPDGDLLAVCASGHQVAILQLLVDSMTASELGGGAASGDTAGISGPSGVMKADMSLRLGFGSGNHVCCAAWDAGGAWLAVGTAQQLHLFSCHARDKAVPAGSTQLRFTPKVCALPIIPDAELGTILARSKFSLLRSTIRARFCA